MPPEAEYTSSSSAEDDGPLLSPAAHRRIVIACIAVLCVVLLVVLPPYISISRYQRRVATAISGSLGRPVHFDRLSLHLLPLPGLTIENFVVSESPEFGAEPVLRANSVEARLRFASLWRRRIEVSRISLDTPSVNLVRRPDTGAWNLQSIVLQAAQMHSAPTAQVRAGDAPRFPYIEASDARINIKNGIDKLPFSIKEAVFALWLPEPGQWRVRLAGRPARTDTDVSDVGLLRVEGTLGRANDLPAAPIDLSLSWKPTQLGEASKLTAGYDLRWRGEISAEATLHGTIGNAKLTTDAHLRGLRRADFVPEHTLDIDAHCEAVSGGLLRSLADIRCAVPTNSETSLFSAIESLRGGGAAIDAKTPGVLRVTGDLPDLLDWRTATLHAALQGAKPAYALAWMRLFTGRIPAETQADGNLALLADKTDRGATWSAQVICVCVLTPAPVAPSQASKTVTVPGDSPGKPLHWTVTLTHDVANPPLQLNGAISATPPHEPQPQLAEAGMSTVPDGRVIATMQVAPDGLSVVYPSADDARLAGELAPQMADGLPENASGVVRSIRTWSGYQVWSTTAPARTRPATRRHRR